MRSEQESKQKRIREDDVALILSCIESYIYHAIVRLGFLSIGISLVVASFGTVSPACITLNTICTIMEGIVYSGNLIFGVFLIGKVIVGDN